MCVISHAFVMYCALHVSTDQTLCVQSFVHFFCMVFQVCALSKLHEFEEPCCVKGVELLLVLLCSLYAAVFVHDHACAQRRVVAIACVRS